MKKAKISTTCKSPKNKLPGITHIPSTPVRSPGEDSVSFKRHNNVLKLEFKKTHRNSEVVADLMKRTFAIRRNNILENTYDLTNIFENTRFLKETPQVRDGNTHVDFP